jgi:hypothetical protein
LIDTTSALKGSEKSLGYSFPERSRTHVFLGSAKLPGKEPFDEMRDADARTENA